MRFYDTRALLLPREGVRLQWGIEPEDTDLTTIEIDVQRSESPSGPFKSLQTIDPLAVFSWTDRTAPWKPKNMELYYRLVGRLRSTGEVVWDCYPFGFQGRLPLDALEMIRQHNILLRGVNGHDPLTGIPTTVYKRRNFGARCRQCTDSVTGRVTISGCRVCGGTGFNGGYYSPIVVYMNFQPHARYLRVSTLGKEEDNETTAFLTNFPILYPGDMVVEPSEKHWRVTQIDVTERKRVVVHQLVRLRQLDHGDVEYETHRHIDNQGV